MTPRPPFTDGFNSFSHAALGAIWGSKGILIFALYQYVLKPDHNSNVDMAEYLIGAALAGKQKANKDVF